VRSLPILALSINVGVQIAEHILLLAFHIDFILVTNTHISTLFRCFFFALEKLISKRKNLYNWDIFSFLDIGEKEGKNWHGFTFLCANILWKNPFLLIRFDTNVFLSRGLLLCKQERQNVSITVDKRAPKPYAYKKRDEIE
jgi:hypothetical protein